MPTLRAEELRFQLDRTTKSKNAPSFVRDGIIRTMRNLHAFAFWVGFPLIFLIVAGSYQLTRGEGPMGERVAALVFFAVIATLIQGTVFRMTKRDRL